MGSGDQIIFTEKYGSLDEQRYYVKPTGQFGVVVIKNEKFSDIVGIFRKIFLPQGYPNSVSKDYIAYQKWDTAQAFCSTIMGIISTQEVLRGVGVGDINASVFAATLMWVLKDGCGHLGRILFAYSHGTYLDAYSKKWRLYADTLNDAAMCIELALPLFKNFTTFALCVSTVMKSIVSVAGSATRIAMTQHHALRGNIADVSAKDSAQETAVNLIASFTGLLIISLFRNTLFIFIGMIILHIIFNYLAVRAVCLRTLNVPRYLQVIATYLKKEIIANPCEINKTEPIIFYQLGRNLLELKVCGSQIKFGQSIAKMINKNLGAKPLKEIRDLYHEKNYILLPYAKESIIYIFLKEGETVDDVLCAYFHAVLFSIVISAINYRQLPLLQSSDPRPFIQVCNMLQSSDWSRFISEDVDVSCEPSYELHKYLDGVVTHEWKSFRVGLMKTGWDLRKHLLVVDEWRLCGESLNKPKKAKPEHSKSDTIKLEPEFSSELNEVYKKLLNLNKTRNEDKT